MTKPKSIKKRNSSSSLNLGYSLLNQIAPLRKTFGSAFDLTLLYEEHVFHKRHDYYIFKYDKRRTDPTDYITVKFFRNIITDNKFKLLCVCPKKSVPLDVFEQTAAATATGSGLPREPYLYEEFVEGVMVNLFWDARQADWEIATRNVLGAEIQYSAHRVNKTYRTMFYEALALCDINLDGLSKNICYSLVLRHPQNRIVAPVATAALYMIEAYKFTYSAADPELIENVVVLNMNGPTKAERLLRDHVVGLGFQIPERYPVATLRDARARYASPGTDYSVMGVVIKNLRLGLRTKLWNPNYQEVKTLRGGDLRDQLRYLVLRHQNAVGSYLRYFPEHKKDFAMWRDQVHRFTGVLYNNYIGCYIRKRRPLAAYPPRYHHLMRALHTHYIDALLPTKKWITKQMVIECVNRLPPAYLARLLNADLYRFAFDQVRAEFALQQKQRSQTMTAVTPEPEPEPKPKA